MSQKCCRLLATISKRTVHTTPIRRLDPKQVEEVRIPVPWGHIAGQWWRRGGAGPKEAAVLVGLHGRRDNAGSWEPLASSIGEGTSFLALDLPGCGRSSRFPPGYSYCWSQLVLSLERVAADKGLEAFTVLGHAEGAQLGCMYAAVYPNRVERLLAFDGVLEVHAPGREADGSRSLIDRLIDPPLKEELYADTEGAAEAVIREAGGSINLESARILVERGTVSNPEGRLRLSRDPRLLEQSFDLLHVDHLIQVARRVTCKVAFVKPSRSTSLDRWLKGAPNFLHVLKSAAKSYKFQTVDGGHYVHMEDPDAVVPLVLDFLRG